MPKWKPFDVKNSASDLRKKIWSHFVVFSLCLIVWFTLTLKFIYFWINWQWLVPLSIKPSLSSQWSLVRSFVEDSICISFVWLTSLWEQKHTKLMQKKSCTKRRTRLHWLESLGLKLMVRWNSKKYVCTPKYQRKRLILHHYFWSIWLPNISLGKVTIWHCCIQN